MPRLCAFGCKADDMTKHRFPDPNKFPQQFKTWVTLVGGTLERPSDYEYFKKRVICDRHFAEADKVRNRRLNRLAVPTLFLPETRDLNHRSPAALTQATAQAELPPSDTDQDHPSPATHTQGISQAELPPSASDTGHPSARPAMQMMQATTSRPSHTSFPSSYLGIRQEHNYSVISRPKFASGTSGGTDCLRKRPGACLAEKETLRTKIKRLRSEIAKLRKKEKSFAARLANAEDLATNPAFQDLVRKMTKPARLFLNMQQQASKKAKGRRFSIEEKVLSLSVYKKSPKCYALLQKYFTLPSVKAMKRLLSQIKLHPGINSVVFKKIRETVSKQNISDRLCSLMFDEMSLTPQVVYNAQKDTMEGFACNKEKAFADHALVFMVKGVKRNFKQPIAYYFTSALKKIELKHIIVDVIKYAQNAGLIIVNTVCDQSSVNVGAITELVNETKRRYMQLQKEWRYEHFQVDGKNIIPIYDTPHLIKGIRNNLLTKDLRYVANDQEKIVKWQYYQMIYAADKSYGELRLVDKLTEEHVNPQKMKKMRVKLATQVFSHSVAVAAEHLSARGALPEECRQVIDITLMLDNLFDSLNGNTIGIPNGKKFKGCVKRNSPHHQLWVKCKNILKTVKYIKRQKATGNKIRITETTIPSVVNFIKTIEGMEAIWKVLSERYGFDMLLTRNFNQDPLENFFGNIRSYGVRNNSPNTVAFEAAFKALLLNNYNSPHSTKANCENDSNECLQTLDFFLREKNADVPADPEQVVQCNPDVFSSNNLQETDAGQRNYVCGWVLTKCLKNIVKGCECCKTSLVDGQDINKRNSFIKAKEYSMRRWLCYPSQILINCFQDIQNITLSFLKTNVPKNNIKRNITAITDVLVEYPFTCNTHREKLTQYFTNITVNVLLYSWCRSVNRILCGKLSYTGDDETKTAAQAYYDTHQKFKSK